MPNEEKLYLVNSKLWSNRLKEENNLHKIYKLKVVLTIPYCFREDLYTYSVKLYHSKILSGNIETLLYNFNLFTCVTRQLWKNQ